MARPILQLEFSQGGDGPTSRGTHVPQGPDGKACCLGILERLHEDGNSRRAADPSQRLDRGVAYGRAHNYVARCGIFFPPTLKEKFTKVSDELWSAVTSKAVGHEAKDFRFQSEAWQRIEADVAPLYKAIETEIHERLRSHGRG